MRILLLAITLASFAAIAQPNTEVYLFDISEDENERLINKRNVSENDDYDSQPYFLAKDVLLYAGTVNGNTEIVQYGRGTKKVFNAPTAGGEYSPQAIPGGRSISAVRLDTTGLQRLYEYKPRKDESNVIVPEAVVAYYVWADETTIVAADIVDDELHLVIHNIATGESDDLEISVGRSFHKIPDSDLISFVDKSEPQWKVKSIHPQTKEIKTIITLPPDIEDICWLPNGTLLIAVKNSIWGLSKNDKWKPYHSFLHEDLQRISRIAASPDGSQLAVVSEMSAAATVQKQVDAYNANDLEAFVATFSENVVVRNFPSDTMYVGREDLRDSYKKWFVPNDSDKVEVRTRITKGNVVIDEELFTSKKKSGRQAAIYEVSNGEITSVTFVADRKINFDPIAPVENLLTAYNKGNAARVMQYFSDDIQFFSYPDRPVMLSKEVIYKSYEGMFKELPDLTSIIEQRIVIGNLVIDKEKLSGDGSTWYGLAIHVLTDGKISKVLFAE